MRDGKNFLIWKRLLIENNSQIELECLTKKGRNDIKVSAFFEALIMYSKITKKIDIM